MYFEDAHGRIVIVLQLLDIAAGEVFFRIIECVLSTERAAEAVAPCYLAADVSLAEEHGGFVGAYALCEGVDLTSERSAVIDDGAPDASGFPPAVIGLVGPEGQEEGDHGAHDHRDRQGNDEVGEVEDLVEYCHGDGVGRDEGYFRLDLTYYITEWNILFEQHRLKFKRASFSCYTAGS